jgi:hypothetical protein
MRNNGVTLGRFAFCQRIKADPNDVVPLRWGVWRAFLNARLVRAEELFGQSAPGGDPVEGGCVGAVEDEAVFDEVDI